MPIDPAKIIAIMGRRQISRAELSRRTGIAPPHITRLLSGQRPDPALSTAEKIATALDCSLARILSHQANPEK